MYSVSVHVQLRSVTTIQILSLLKLINNSSSLDKENHDCDGVWITHSLILFAPSWVEHKATMVFGYLILISIDFLRFYFSIFSLALVSIEKICQTLKTVFDHISKHLKACQKYYAARIFNSPLSVWKCGQTRSFVFDILLPRCQSSK